MMSKINIKVMSEAAIAYLKNNSEEVTNKILANDNNSWIHMSFPNPIFKEKKIEIEDFDLVDNPESKDKYADFRNSVLLYEHLKDVPKYILTNQGFWLWLYFEKFYPIIKNMMPIKGVSTFKDHWMFASGVRRGIFFGVLSRCYFRVALTVDEQNKDYKYHLTKWIIENPERFRNITWRTYSSEEHLVRGIIRAEKRAVEELGKEDTSVYKEIAKYVSDIGSVMLLDVISEDDIEKMVYNRMVELLA